MSNAAAAIENLELVTGLLREEMGVVPDLSGNLVGPLFVNARARAGWRRIHCSEDVAESGLAIPARIEDYETVSCAAKYTLVLET